jgi:SAM-dependent methyltransferase
MNEDCWQKHLNVNAKLSVEFTSKEMKNKIKIHLNRIPSSCSDVLDLGAGDGYSSEYLQNLGKNVIATSINPKEVEYMKKNGISAQLEDMHILSFESESFDCVYMRQVLEHALAPYLVFCEINRVLRESGYCILIVPPEIDLFMSNENSVYLHNSATKHYSVLTEIQLKTLWEKVDFELKDKWVLKTPHGTDVAYLLKKENENGI